MGADGVRAPKLEQEGSLSYRVCEIRQLEGSALDACRTSLDCAGCEPGWCVTQVPELVPPEGCNSDEHYPPFRFVLGAGQARSALGTIVYNLEAGP